MIVRNFTPVPMELPAQRRDHGRGRFRPSSDCSSEFIRRGAPRVWIPIVALRAETILTDETAAFVIGLALATLRENKVRSFLTVLGVIIGTGHHHRRRVRSWPAWTARSPA